MLPSLFQIRQDHLGLINLIEDNGGEVDAEILSMLELNESNFNEKAVSYSNVIKVFENDESIIDAEIKRLQEMKKRKTKAKEAFEGKLVEAMNQFGVNKIETPTRKLSFKKSEAVEILDESLIPTEYKDFVPAQFVVSKTVIKNAIKAGNEVPGAQLITKNNLQIK